MFHVKQPMSSDLSFLALEPNKLMSGDQQRGHLIAMGDRYGEAPTSTRFHLGTAVLTVRDPEATWPVVTCTLRGLGEWAMWSPEGRLPHPGRGGQPTREQTGTGPSVADAVCDMVTPPDSRQGRSRCGTGELYASQADVQAFRQPHHYPLPNGPPIRQEELKPEPGPRHERLGAAQPCSLAVTVNCGCPPREMGGGKLQVTRAEKSKWMRTEPGAPPLGLFTRYPQPSLQVIHNDIHSAYGYPGNPASTSSANRGSYPVGQVSDWRSLSSPDCADETFNKAFKRKK